MHSLDVFHHFRRAAEAVRVGTTSLSRLARLTVTASVFSGLRHFFFIRLANRKRRFARLRPATLLFVLIAFSETARLTALLLLD